MAVIIRFKRGQASTWESKNLLLSPGEPGFELDTKQLKIGDGTTVWNELPYINDNERLQTIEEALENVYTKSDIDSKLTALFRYKGSKKSYDQLPEADENQTGDVWNIETADETHKIKAGDNVAWNGNEWDVLSGVFDLSDYVKKDGDKQLSTEDYTTEDKEKLSRIEDGAQVNEVSSEEFSGLEERVNTLETDAETLAKADGSNATGKWVGGANEADKLTTARTINGAEFDGTGNVNTHWSFNNCRTFNNKNGVIKIIDKVDGNLPSAPILCLVYITPITTVGREMFSIYYTYRENTPQIKVVGNIDNGIVKYNNDGVYINWKVSSYWYIAISLIGESSYNDPNFGKYINISDIILEPPEDLIDAVVTRPQMEITGTQGQVVGFDTNGNAQATEIGGTNLIPNTSTKIATNGWRAYNSPNDVDIIDGYAVSKGFYGNYISLCAPKNKTRIALPAGDYTAYVDAIIENVQEDIRETTKFALYLLGVDKTISKYSSYILGNFIALDDKPHRYTIHFHTDIELIGTLSMAVLYYHLQDAADADKYKDITIRIKDFKLERGSVATDWSPAPEDIQEIASGPKYGVSGVGGSSPTLTRLWDAVGLTAAVGTDTQTAKNDFDNLPPFNRRKCVGTWSEPDATGKAHFTVKAYADEPGYTEDGTMGDYVAVEVEPFYYIQDMKNGIWGVSPKYQPGWKIHPVCINKKDKTVREKTYLPCYELCLDNGKGASLPGHQPVHGSYKSLRDMCELYNEAGYLEPAEVRNYEELLFTIEFATTNCQSIMNGAVSMPYVATDVNTVAGESVNYLITTPAIANKYLVGQSIYIGTNYSTTPAEKSNDTAYHIITKIEDCGADGGEGTGSKKITFDGAAITTTTTTQFSSRPWITGSCNTVLTPSGSPVSNTDGKHPMRYRWRENLWGNLYSTSNDLFDHYNGTDIDYYYLTDPSWKPTATSNPNLEELQKDPFIKLSPKCDNKTGAIKTLTPDDTYSYCTVPTDVTGTTGTYYCDNMWLVSDTVPVRSFRFGCFLNDGVNAGLFAVTANSAPSSAYWSCGGGLFLEQ